MTALNYLNMTYAWVYIYMYVSGFPSTDWILIPGRSSVYLGSDIGTSEMDTSGLCLLGTPL